MAITYYTRLVIVVRDVKITICLTRLKSK